MRCRLLLVLCVAALLAAGRAVAPAAAQDQPPAAADTLQGSGSAAGRQAVQFSARDSLTLVFDTEAGDVATLYGEAEATHGEAELQAHTIEMLMAIDELRASALPTDTGMVGLPQFQRGSEEGFVARQLAFNMRTERGRVVEARTSMQEGFIEGEVIKVMEDGTKFAQGGLYTTCDCPPGETPSYSLRSTKMKEQDQWVYTGPIQLYIFNIPTPFWLPFGFLPAIEGRRSGPLAPDYGEDERGFFLRNWGWYWAISDYMDFQVTGGLWSRGSWQITPFFRYSKRYEYSGNIRLDYLRQINGDVVDPDYINRSTASLRWGHNQELNPTSSFNADVNLVSSASYLRTVSEDYDDRVRQEIGSSIRYRKNWERQDFGISLRHSQNLANGSVNLTLPDLSFSQSSLKPFERESRAPGQDRAWYERITFDGYRFSLNNRYRFDPITDAELRERGDTTATGEVIQPDIAWYEALVSPGKYRRATGEREAFNFSADHQTGFNAPFTLSQLPLLGRFQLNVSPNVNYSEEWFIRTERRAVNDSTGRVTTQEEPGFFALRQFSTGISANTTFYGLFPVQVGAFTGVRHTVRPSLSFSYQPDYYGDFWGYTRTYTDTSGAVERYPIVSGVPRGERRVLSFSIGNEFETKRVRVDSTGEEQSEIFRLLDLDLNSGYNFAADSLKLSNINLSARLLPNVFRRFQLSLNANFSPYVLQNRRTIDRFVFEESPWWPLRLTNLRISSSTSLQGAQRGESRPVLSRGGGPGPYGPAGGRGAGFGFRPDPFTGAPGRYADFSIPWSVDLSLNYRLQQNAQGAYDSRASLNVGFGLNLTPNWRIDGRTGYDFERWELVTTDLSITRDLDCWQMAFRWVPFGQYQSYSFTLQVKSGKLRDLLRLNLPRSDIKGRFSGAFAR